MTERPKTYDYVAEDLGKVRDLISRSLHSDIELLNDTNSSILDHPGKMMRPVLALLAAKACSGGELSEDSYSYAAAAELLHNATLLHDDVADNSSSRRGRPTVMKLLGGNAAVLLGDYWLVRAMEKILSGKRRRDDAMSVFYKTLSDLAQGEMLQLQKSISGDLTEEEYFRVIYCKTASLFEASAVTGAYSVEAPEEYVEAVRAYAVNLGLAFQIKDDIFDYQEGADIGKPVGHDLLEQKITLPLLCALEEADEEGKRHIRNMVSKAADHPGNIGEIVAFVKAHDGVAKAASRLEEFVDKAVAALSVLPPGPYRSTLETHARYAAERKF